MPPVLRQSIQHVEAIPSSSGWAARNQAWAGGVILLTLVVFLGLGYLLVWQYREAQRDNGIATDPAGRLVERRPPTLPAIEFLPVTAQEAAEMNAKIPLSRAAIELAHPFYLPREGVAAAGNSRALQCLTSAIYYEAGGEPLEGQLAVAQVVLNRVRHPAFPKSVCEVVFQGAERKTGCQFSFTCDGSLSRRPSRSGWARALDNAKFALSGGIEPLVGTSTHFHTKWVVPYWASSLDKVGLIGAHIFYRWKGQWGRRSAFSAPYAGESLSDDVLPMAMVQNLDNATPLFEPPSPALPNLIIADDGPQLPHSRQTPSSSTLRADNEAGTLLIDQAANRLPVEKNP